MNNMKNNKKKFNFLVVVGFVAKLHSKLSVIEEYRNTINNDIKNRVHSSMVEHLSYKQRVIGSSPFVLIFSIHFIIYK